MNSPDAIVTAYVWGVSTTRAPSPPWRRCSGTLTWVWGCPSNLRFSQSPITGGSRELRESSWNGLPPPREWP